jgi:acetyl esterase/lipase
VNQFAELGAPPPETMSVEDNRALAATGVDATDKRYDGMIHAFLQLGAVIDRSRELVDDCAAGLRAGLS